MAVIIFIPKDHKLTAKQKYILKNTFNKANNEIVERWDGVTVLRKNDLAFSNHLPPYRLLNEHTVLNVFSALKLNHFIRIEGFVK